MITNPGKKSDMVEWSVTECKFDCDPVMNEVKLLLMGLNEMWSS